MDATRIEVKMSLAEFQVLQENKQQLEERIAALENDLAQAQINTDTTGLVRRLLLGLEAAREVAGFAVAYLAPETVRDWPSNALTTLANTIAAVPGATMDHQSQAADWILFAREAAIVDEMRARRNQIVKDARD